MKTLEERLQETRGEMTTKGICSSCIYLYDEGILTCCIKNNRWEDVEYDQKCDIDAWEGFELP